MASYRNPICMAPDPESWRGVCGVEMKLAGERHPLHQLRAWTFVCPKCEAATILTEDQLKRTAQVR
jgi:hypothetical protein